MASDDHTFPDTQIVDISESLDEDQVSAMLDRTVAGKYRILRRLARGGMGVVYVAEHITLGRKVVIKVLSYHLADDSRAKSRFEREARGLSVLDHPNIVTVHDFGIEKGLTYIVMEYVDGENLSQRVRRKGRITYDELLPIVVQTIDAIACAHQKGIVHRDVKPSNVMVTTKANREDYVKVLDFGLAKLATQSVDITKGNLVGTVSYLSPEVIKGADALPTTDVYALGVMFYYLLAGTKPFQANDDMSVLYQHVNVEADWLGDVVPSGEVPHEFLEFVHHCMQKDPTRRPTNAMEMRELLASLVSLPSISAFSLDSAMALPRYAPPDSSAEALKRPRHTTSPPPSPGPPARSNRSTSPSMEVSQGSMTRPSIARARPKRGLRIAVIAFTSFSIGLVAIAAVLGGKGSESKQEPAPAPEPAPIAEVEPVEEPAAPATGTFALTTEPIAKVAVDGELQGASPIELELEPGTHVVSATADGYEVWTQSIEITGGQRRDVDVFLNKVGSAAEARVEVESSPQPVAKVRSRPNPKPAQPEPIEQPVAPTTTQTAAQASNGQTAEQVEAKPKPKGEKDPKKNTGGLLSVDGKKNGLLPVNK